MQVAGYMMSDQNVAADFLEKILSRKCKIHQQFSCEYLHLKPSEFSPRLCFQCMENRNIPLSEAISIRLLLLATSNTTFNAYPKFSDSSITQKILSMKDSDDRIFTDLSSFFNNLNSKVSEAIERAKNASKQNLDSLSISYQSVFNSLGQISKIEQFQDIVKNTNDNEENLKEFIQEQYSSIDNYTEMINNKLQEHQMIQQSFSLTGANNKLNEIVQLIEGITFFPTIANNQQQSQQPLQQQQNLFQQPAQQQQPLGESQQVILQNLPSFSESEYESYKSLVKQCEVKNASLWWWSQSVSTSLYSQEEWQELSKEEKQDVISFYQQQLSITDRIVL